MFTGALGAGIPAFVLVSRLGTPPAVQPVSAQALAERLARADSHMTGNLQSPVTVVEFGDFECPACATAEETAREIRRRYGSRIRFVFRQFPLARLHPQSLKAAEASECAAEQGKFWEAVERLYQARGDLSEAALVRYSGELGIDMARFRQCLTSGSMFARVRRDLEDALALGLRATPTFFVGRQRIEGPLELGHFSRLVEKELAVSGASPAEVGVAPASTPRAKQAAEQRRPAGSSPGSSASFGSGGLLVGSVFTQLQGSAPGCSEEEALKQQPTLIQTPEARHLFEEQPKALFVDIRHVADYKSGRIPGAINIPPDEIERSWNRLPRGRDIVLYESGRSPGDICAASRAAGRTLLSHGFSVERVKVYQDGLAGWEKAGLPVEH